jgi:hypothetical protein
VEKMSNSKRQLHLNVFIMNAGHHEAAWHHPETEPHNITDIRYFQRLEEFAELVVPELQRRGLFRTEYSDTTLRGHFGLSRPANQFTKLQEVLL